MDKSRVSEPRARISLLLPTRGRAALVQRLFDSLVQTTAEMERLEVVLYVDEDDAESLKIEHQSLSPLKIVGRSGATMGHMTRACYEASHGDYVMLINDDLVFRTKGWDARVRAAATRYPDDIALVYGNDLDQGEAVPTFPIVSRTVCDVLGEVCPRGYRHLHIESHLLDIFKQLARLGHRRIFYLDDVIFEHMHFIMGKAGIDSTYAKKDQRLDDLLFIALDDQREFQARLLARWIDVARSNAPTEAAVSYPAAQGGQFNQRASLVSLLKRMLHFR